MAICPQRIEVRMRIHGPSNVSMIALAAHGEIFDALPGLPIIFGDPHRNLSAWVEGLWAAFGWSDDAP